MQGVLVSLQVHLLTDTPSAKCGLLGVTMSADPDKVTCYNCGRTADPKWLRKSRVHFEVGTRISCGRENVRSSKRWAEVTCGICLKNPRNRKAERRNEEGYADPSFKGRGILNCRVCGRKYRDHVGYQQCIPKDALRIA